MQHVIFFEKKIDLYKYVNVYFKKDECLFKLLSFKGTNGTP